MGDYLAEKMDVLQQTLVHIGKGGTVRLLQGASQEMTAEMEELARMASSPFATPRSQVMARDALQSFLESAEELDDLEELNATGNVSASLASTSESLNSSKAIPFLDHVQNLYSALQNAPGA